MQVFGAPVAADELIGKIVQQGRVTGRTAVDAKVIGCGDDALAELVTPHAIGIDAGCKRVSRVDEPFGKQSFRRGDVIGILRDAAGQQHTECPWSDQLAWLVGLAALQQMHI